MRRLVNYCFIGLLLIPALAGAHGPSRQQVQKEMEINASPDKVWAVISEFCSIQDWHPAVSKCESNGSHDKGTTRVLTLDNGESFTEELLKHEPEKMSYAYRITEANHDAVPVGTYGSTIMVKEGSNGGAVVNWRGFFYRAYPNNDPPPELSDQAAIDAVTAIYDAGLAKIKELAE